MTTRGRFTYKTMMEQVTFLKHFIDKHTSSIIKPLQAKVTSSVEESSSVESKPLAFLDLTLESSPEPRTLKERVIHPLEVYGNTLKHF
jgi:hypothetical protein